MYEGTSSLLSPVVSVAWSGAGMGIATFGEPEGVPCEAGGGIAIGSWLDALPGCVVIGSAAPVDRLERGKSNKLNMTI